LLYGVAVDVEVLFYQFYRLYQEGGFCTVRFGDILYSTVGLCTVRFYAVWLFIIICRFVPVADGRVAFLLRTGFLFGFIAVALLYQVADAEQQDFFFMLLFHLFLGLIDIEADAC